MAKKVGNRTMSIAEADRADRRVGVVADEDAPGNWCIFERRNPRCVESLAPMSRAAFTEVLGSWFPPVEVERPEAVKAYAGERGRVLKLLTLIRAALDEHADRARDLAGADYGTAADLAKASENLEHALAELRGR